MVKKELFKFPILGRAMRMGSLVPVDRGNRDAGIEAVRAAKSVVDKKLNLLIYVEGKRSFDGKLLPFKKGPFYLAVECGVPVIPVTIVGTHYTMPKKRFAIKPGLVKVIFHDPIEPKDFGSRDDLQEKVRAAIESGLPERVSTRNGNGRPRENARRNRSRNRSRLDQSRSDPPCSCRLFFGIFPHCAHQFRQPRQNCRILQPCFVIDG